MPIQQKFTPPELLFSAISGWQVDPKIENVRVCKLVVHTSYAPIYTSANSGLTFKLQNGILHTK